MEFVVNGCSLSVYQWSVIINGGWWQCSLTRDSILYLGRIVVYVEWQEGSEWVVGGGLFRGLRNGGLVLILGDYVKRSITITHCPLLLLVIDY